jgi:hypothetical protein
MRIGGQIHYKRFNRLFNARILLGLSSKCWHEINSGLGICQAVDGDQDRNAIVAAGQNRSYHRRQKRRAAN